MVLAGAAGAVLDREERKADSRGLVALGEEQKAKLEEQRLRLPRRAGLVRT